jgi:hypothetical protein
MIIGRSFEEAAAHFGRYEYDDDSTHHDARALINSGQNPFVVWREIHRLSVKYFCEGICWEPERYFMLCRAEFEPTHKEILQFCNFFEIQPYHMAASKKPLGDALIASMISVYLDPAQNLKGHHYRAEHIQRTAQRLKLEASPEKTLDPLWHEFMSHRDWPQANMICEFLAFLIANDGNKDLLGHETTDGIIMFFDIKCAADKQFSEASCETAKGVISAEYKQRMSILGKLFGSKRSVIHNGLFNSYINAESEKRLDNFLKRMHGEPGYLAERARNFGVVQLPHITAEDIEKAQKALAKSFQTHKAQASLLLKNQMAVSGYQQQRVAFQGWLEVNCSLIKRFVSRQAILARCEFDDMPAMGCRQYVGSDFNHRDLSYRQSLETIYRIPAPAPTH